MKNNENDKKYVIYALLQETSGRLYVHYATEKSKRHVYKDHLAGKNRYTKDMFREFKDAGSSHDRPKVYILSEGIDKEACYYHELAWVRYFLDHGFKLLNNEYEVEDAGDLRETALEIYEDIRNLPLDDVLSDENDATRNYRKRETLSETDDEKYLTARVTAAEYRKVKENAEAAGMALNAYIKSAALNSQIIVFNYDAVLEHIRQINEIKKVLYPFIAAALRSQKVFEADIYKVISLMQSIETSEKRLIKAVKNERDRFNRKYQ